MYGRDGNSAVHQFLARGVAITLLVVLTLAISETRTTYAICTSSCNHETCTDCGSGWECASACTSSSCNGFTYCSCTGSCNLLTKHVEESCTCKERPVGQPGGQSRTWVIAMATNIWWSLTPPGANPLTFAEFGVAVEDLSGWGVVLAGNPNHTIAGGDYSGSFNQIIEAIGVASGFTASWNQSTHVVTFTGI